MSTFTQSKGVVVHERGTTRGFDPTGFEQITITRPDGVEFTISQFWSWRLIGPKDDLVVENRSDVEAWLKKHSLPSLQWIEEQVQLLDRIHRSM